MGCRWIQLVADPPQFVKKKGHPHKVKENGGDMFECSLNREMSVVCVCPVQGRQ